MGVKKEKILVLLDMHAILHRAFHALPSFSSPKGEATSALYGFTAFLLKVIRELKPDYIAACLDLPEPTFRHAAYDGYKGKRPEIASDLASQITRSYDILKAFSIPALEHKSFEADDIIGTIVERTKSEKNLKVIIASGDLDTLQLVSGSRVCVYTLRKGLQDTIIYDEKKVKERYGFGPKLLPDFKGLKGDPSDNIIGVPGIGEKTASELIAKFGSLEEIYKKLKKDKKSFIQAGVKERTLKLLEEHEEEAFFSKTLGEIRLDAPIKFLLKDADWASNFKKEKLQELFKDLGFMSLLARLPEIPSGEKESESEREAEDSLDFLRKSPEIFWHLDKEEKKIYGAAPEGQIFVFDAVADALKIKEIIQDAGENYFFGAKEIFRALKIAPVNISGDIKISAWLSRSQLTEPSLETAIHNFLPKEFIAPGEILKAVRLLPELARAVNKELEEKNLSRVLRDIELPLIPVLYRMEERGILIDLKLLKKLSEEYGKKLGVLESKIWKLAGFNFNINSPKQLAEVLYEKLGIKVKGGRKTSLGARSTRESELIKMKGMHPAIEEILTFRELSKLKSTYLDALPKLADGEGRVHTNFLQAGTTTGRLSSAEPNLQNIPIRTDTGREVRKAFIAKTGYVLLAFDYSQMELRIAAVLSKDKKMMEAFREEKDIHTIAAKEVFNVSEAEVTPEMRRKAKIINFGILYGMGINALATAMDVPREKAQIFWEEYFKDFEGLARLIEEIKAKAREKGYVETIFGRRRYIPEICSDIEYIRKEAERMAVNAPIQGTAADIMKFAMIASEKYSSELPDESARLLLQIHDELLFEIKKDEAPNFIKEMKNILENIYKCDVPIMVEAKMGRSWGEMKKVN